jgi:hypothetical protein
MMKVARLLESSPLKEQEKQKEAENLVVKLVKKIKKARVRVSLKKETHTMMMKMILMAKVKKAL